MSHRQQNDAKETLVIIHYAPCRRRRDYFKAARAHLCVCVCSPVGVPTNERTIKRGRCHRAI